jgi:hypothetical protein
MGGAISGLLLAACGLLLPAVSPAQTCSTGAEIEPSTLSAVQNAASGYFASAHAENAPALQQAAEFDLGDVLAANRDLLSGQATLRSVYVLDSSPEAVGNPKAGQPEQVNFYCGIYNSASRVAFSFGHLLPGKYAVVLQDVSGGKGSATVAWVLHHNGAQWKIAGLFVKPAQIAGHDANWFLSEARSYQAKGKNRDAWLFYLAADDLLRPFPAMSTAQIEQRYEEMQKVRQPDLPNGAPVDFAVGGRVFKVTEVYPTAVGGNLDLVVRYQASDISDTARTFQENTALIKEMVKRDPELRDAFSGVVARAVAPNGQDYGTLLAMKDIK